MQPSPRCRRLSGSWSGAPFAIAARRVAQELSQQPELDSNPLLHIAQHLLDFGVTNERAWEVGLACGGKVKVFVEKLV